MPSYAHPVHPALSDYVASCVGYDYVTHPDDVHHGKPSPAATVILAFEEPLDCGLAGEGSALWWSLVGGLHTRPAVIRTHGRQCGIQLGLTPAGVRAVFGIPVAALAETLAPAGELGRVRRATVAPGPVLSPTLHAELAELGWGDRFALLERRLLAAVGAARPGRMARPEVAEAWRRVLDSHGAVRVADLAQEVGWSRRHLHTQFVAEYGVTPKEAGRIVRFDHARSLVEHGRPLALAATLAGYVDQSHLNREWRALAGQTPTQTLTDMPAEFASER